MENQEAFIAIATSLRCLSMDMVQSANSGHPGLPMGMADVMAVLYGKYLKHDPSDPKWSDRDRFVLSAGHGSSLLYALLHISGYDLPLSELRRFRQLNSATAGHPEYGHTVGVETTTGPLAAGFATAVGMAIAEANLAKRFNQGEAPIVDHKTYVVLGDGCMMEGLSSEGASLAGHLKLGKLIAIYDSNQITIEGKTDLAFSENVAMRFESYGWRVIEIDGHNYDAIDGAFAEAITQKDGDKPLLIIAKTVIGKGAATKAGSHKIHGAPLGQEEIIATRKALGVPEGVDFYVDPRAIQWMQERRNAIDHLRGAYQNTLLHWQRQHPDLNKEWEAIHAESYDYLTSVHWEQLFNEGDKVATRVASGRVLQEVAKHVPALMGGSADLAPSNNTAIVDWPVGFSAEHREAKMLHFGIREHAMASIANGLALHGGVKVFCATFLVFSDYMRAAMRLAALMHLPVVYVLTHDSIYVGEDGPTHQPIEQIESLRLIPNMTVLRPADAQESAWAWQWALRQKDAPVVLALSRQDLPVLPKPHGWQEGMAKGGYIAFEPKTHPQVVLLATGSEVSLAVAVAEKISTAVRVVSVSSRRLLEQNVPHYRHLVGDGLPVISVEAGVRGGWASLASAGALSIERFGASGKAGEVAEDVGLTLDALMRVIEQAVNN